MNLISKMINDAVEKKSHTFDLVEKYHNGIEPMYRPKFIPPFNTNDKNEINVINLTIQA